MKQWDRVFLFRVAAAEKKKSLQNALQEKQFHYSVHHVTPAR
jgi:hypothetical protein